MTARPSPCRLTKARALKTLHNFHAHTPPAWGCYFELATLSDLQIILDISAEAFPADASTRQEIRYFLTRAHALILIIKNKQGKPIGYLHLEGNSRTKSIYVNTFVLIPSWQGKGIGKSFYTLQEKLAMDAEFYTIRLHISEKKRHNLDMAHTHGYEDVWFGPYLEDGSKSYLLRKRLRGRRSS
jgi:GNAT superfamily N-acetyltransferase